MRCQSCCQFGLQLSENLTGLKSSLRSALTWQLAGGFWFHPVGLAIGLLMTWKLAFPRVSDPREGTRQRHHSVTYNLNSEGYNTTSAIFYWSHRPIMVKCRGRLSMGGNHRVPSWRLTIPIHSLDPNDSHPFPHAKYSHTFSRSPKVSSIMASGQSLEYCHLNQLWVHMDLVRYSFLCIVP